jgi:hypothetical protein
MHGFYVYCRLFQLFSNALSQGHADPKALLIHARWKNTSEVKQAFDCAKKAFEHKRV